MSRSRNWLKMLRGALTRRTPIRRQPYLRPWLEQLEDRTLMDAVKWNVAASGFWDVASNWLDTTTSTSHVPTSADVVTINQAGVTVTIESGGQSINSLQCANNLTISGGSLTIAAASEIDGALSVNATLTTNGVLTLTNSGDTWSNSTINGSGSIANQGTITLTGTSGETLSTTLTNTGTITQTAAGTLTVNGALQNQAQGLFDMQAAGLGTAVNGGGTITNAGTFRRSVATDQTAITDPFVNQGGTLDVHTGTLQLTNGGANTGGAFNAQSGATLDISGSFTGTYTGTGGGAILLNNGILIGAGGATFDFGTGMFQWSGNSINLDGNTLTNTGAMTFANGSGNLFGNTGFFGGGTGNQGGTLDNQGTILQTSGTFTLYDSVVLKNEGTFNLTGDAGINFGNFSPSILNTSTGLFEKTGGTNTSNINVPVTNNGGTFNAASGTLNLNDGVSSTNGNFNAQSPGTLGLSGIVSGTFLGSGTGTVDTCGTLQILPAGATFDFTGALFRWTGNDINLDGNTLTNTGEMTIATNGPAIRGYIPSGAGNQGGTFDNQGTVLQTGYFYLYDSVAVTNEGTFDNTSDADINYGNNSPSITNNSTGTFEKTGGTGTSHVNVLFNNVGGIVNATSGTLALNGGTSSTNGNFNAQVGGIVGLGGAASGTYLGTGTGAVEITATLNPALLGATFDFTGSLFQWTGNDINLDGNTLTNTGQMTIATNGPAIRGYIPSGAGNQGGTFDNQGTIQQVASFYYLYDSVAITNEGAYDFTGDADIDYGGENPTITNNATGLFEKTGGTGTSHVNVLFNNTGGTVNGVSGTLALNGGTSSANGDFNAQTGAIVGIGGVASGAYLGSGAGAVEVTNTLQVLPAGATFDFTGSLFQWTGNDINLDGNTLTNTGQMTIATNGVAIRGYIPSGAGNQGGTFDNQGTIQQVASFYYLYDSVAITNEGTYDFTGDADIDYGNNSPSITNNATGMFEKTGGTGSSHVNVLFNNTGGTVNGVSGTLALNGGTSSTNGNFNAQSGGAVGLGGVASGAYLGSGAGAVGLTANVTILPAGATFDFTGSVFQWTNNSINLDANTLINTGAIAISTNGNSFYGNNGAANQGGTFDNKGAFLQPSGYFYLYDSVTFTNEGTYNFTGDADLDFGNYSPTMTNTSTGTIEKTGGTNTSHINVPLANQGTIDGQSGILYLSDGIATTGGAFNADGGGTVDFGGVITGAFTGAGTGAVGLGGNVLIGTGGATFNFPTGLFQWTHNGIDLDGQTLTNTGSMTATTNGDSFYGNTQIGGGTANQGGIFDNQGTFLQPTGYFYLYDSVTFQNDGTYNFTGNANVYVGNFSPSFANTSTGLVEKTGGAGTSAIDVPFNNLLGTLNAAFGTLTLGAGGASTGGTFNTQTGATLDLTGGQTNTFGGTYTGSGGGAVSLSHGTLAPAAAGATFNFPAGLFVWSGGAISGVNAGALTNAGSMTITTGNEKDFNNAAVLNNSGTITDSGTYRLQFYGNSVVNNLAGGVFNFTKSEAMTQYSGGSGTFNNQLGATLESTGSGNTHLVPLNNLGTVDIEAGNVSFSTVTQISSGKLTGGAWILGGAGKLTLQSGNLTENDGTVTLAGGTFTQLNALATNTGTLNLTGGASFTTAGNLQNSGTINVGPTSVLNVGGGLTLTAASTLTFQIAGIPASGEFGQIAVHSAATLAGTLNLVLASGFGPLSGQVFQVATYASATGSFATITGQTVNGVQVFSAAVNPTALVLNSLVDASDLAPVSITADASALVGQSLHISYQVNNLKNLATLTNAWTDSIYLSADGALDAASILLTTIPHSGTVAANGNYTASASVTVPAVLPGNYSIMVNVDSAAQNPDSDRTNNIAPSAGTVAIDYQVVSPGGPVKTSVASGQSVYYRLNVPAGSDVMLTAALTQAGAAKIYLSAGAIPTPTSYQQTATVSGQNLNLPLLDTGAGPYFVLIQGQSGAGAGTPLTVSMRYLGFEVVAVAPPDGPNAGSTTITVSGSHFSPTTTVSLVSTTGATLTPTNVQFGNSNTLTATFDLDGVKPQFESVKISDQGQTFTAPSAFQVIPNVTTVSGIITSNTEWLGGVVYHVIGNIEVASGTTLTIDPGAIVKFDANLGMTIDSGATLTALGTSTNPIVFTSIRDDANGGDSNGDGNATTPAPGDWSQILNSGTASFDHVSLLYGSGVGNTGLNSGAIHNSGGTVTFSDGIISQAFYDGIDTVGGSIAISNSLIVGADRGVVSTFGGSSISIVNSTLDDNRIGLFAHVGGFISVTNSIVSGSLQIGVDTDNVPVAITYSDVYSTVAGAVNYSGMTDQTGANGNISADPKYVNAAGGDYRLNFLSPAIDAANTPAAPLTDMAGNARYNDPRTNPKTGVASAGLYADMGALEFVESAASSIDFQAVNVAGPALAVAGQTATVTWTDENTGAASALGGWHDQVNLVLNPGPGQTVIPAASVLVAANTTLGPSQALNLSASVTVPGGVPGNYFWQVVPDAAGDVFQGTNQGVGAGIASVTTAVSVPSLAVNGASSAGNFTSPGQSLWYEVIPTSTADLLLTLNSPAPSGDVELYAAQGFMPSPTNFQEKSQQFNVPHPTLVISAPQIGVPYFVIVYGRTLTSTPLAVTLSATTPSFGVTGVSPTSLGNSGPATLTIFGGQLAANDTYQLVGPGGTFTATSVAVQDSSTVNATFNLNGATAGTYSVKVTPLSGSPATLANAVHVQQAIAATLSTQVLVPSAFRVGRVFHGTVVYTNTGNVDMPAPLLNLSTGGQAELSLDGMNFSTNDLQLIGVSFSGPTGTLRPGETWSIPFEVLCNANTTLNFSLTYDLATDTTPVDYTALATQVRPAGISDSYWNTAWPQFQSQAGPTWGGIVSLLAQYTQAVADSGNAQFDSETMVFGYAIKGNLQQAEVSASGHVYLNNTTYPLANAQVVLANADNTVASGGVSNPDGSFVVDGLPAGTYDVTVDGYLQPSPVTVTVPATGAANGLSIVATTGGTISGTVLSATNGGAIVGTTVAAVNTADDSSFSTVTAADGSYSLNALPDGTYNLTVGSSPYETQFLAGIAISGGSVVSGQNFTLAAGASLSGTVMANGMPAADATVAITDANGNEFSTSTDSNGNYSFSGLAASSYTLTVNASTFAISSNTLVLAGGATMTAPTVTLSAVDTFNATIVDPSSQPLADGVVQVTQAGQAVETVGANAQGLVAFTDLADGTYQLTISAQGFANQTDSVTLANGATVARTYHMTVGNQIKGAVTDGNGLPIPNTLVNLFGTDTNGNQIAAQTTTLSDGTYALTSIPAGTYTITIGGGAGIDGQSAIVAGTSSTNNLNFQITGGGIQGNVVAADGTTPATGADVLLVKSGQIVAEGQTDSTGHYMFQGLAAGSYQVLASTSGNDAFTPSQAVTVSGNATTTAALATMGNTTYAGVAQDSAGNPVVGASVILTPVAGAGSGLAATTQTAADGSFSVSGLAPGAYTVSIQGQNYAGVSSTVTVTDVSNPPQTFALQRGTDITGQIVDAGGNPISGATVQFVDPTTDQVVGQAITDSSGNYVDTTVAPGVYDVLVSESSHQVSQQFGVHVDSAPTAVDAAMANESTTLSGVVTDSNGHVIKDGAFITIRNSDGDIVGTASASILDGSYHVSELPPGTYTVTFEAEGHGYTVSTSTVTLSNGQNAMLNASMNSDGTATQNPTQTVTGTPVSTAPPGNSTPPVLTAPTPVAPPDPPTSPHQLQNDPALMPPDLSQTKCADAARARQIVQADIARVAAAYANWQDAYGAYVSVGRYNLLIDLANAVSLGAALVWDAYAGALGSVVNGLANSVLTVTKLSGDAAAAAQRIEKLAGVGFNLVTLVRRLGSYIAGKSFPASSNSTANLVGNVGTVTGFISSEIGVTLSVIQAAGVMADLATILKVIPSAIPLGSIAAAFSLASDWLKNGDQIAKIIGAPGNAETYYFDAMDRYRDDLQAFYGDNPQCPPPVTKSPGGSGGGKQGGGGQSGGNQAGDPNDMTTTGFGTQGYVTPTATVTYTIDFENEPTANAAAQEVVITDPLPASIDWASVQLTSIAFNGVTLDIAPGLTNYSATATVSTDPTHPVDVEASLDPATGIITWTLTSTDPLTKQLTEDPLAGFLPPDNAQGQGEGYVTYTANPIKGIADATVIDSQATVVFDVNAPINTPTVVNTIDATAPTSSVSTLPATSPHTFTVSWAGQDTGSGIAAYNVYVSDNGGPYAVLATGTLATSASFTGVNGHTYTFYSVALDNVGNVEPTPASPQATTTVVYPQITGVTPNEGPEGGNSTVTITGINLGTQANATVDFGPGNPASIISDDGTTLVVHSPAGQVGMVDISVATPNGTTDQTAADQYTYVPPPTIISIAPSVGPATGGTSVTITGLNLGSAATASVDFGLGNLGTIVSDDGSTIVATSPAGAAGLIDVTVTTLGGTSTTSAADQFTYYATSFASLSSPTITYGAAAVVSGQLNPNPASPLVPTGETVQVTIDGVVQNAPLDATDHFSATFAAGTLGAAATPYTVSLSYGGDAVYAGSTGTTSLSINQATPTFSGLSTPTITYGTASTTVSGHLNANAGSLSVPAGEIVQVTLNGVTQNAPLDASDNFTTSFNTAALGVTGSPHAIGFSYAGDASFTSAADSSGLTVNPATPSFHGVSVPAISYGTASNLISIQVTWNAPTPAGETVAVTLNGVTQNASLNSGSYTTTFDTTALDVAGSTYPVSFDYAGDANFNSITTSSTLTVNQATQTIAFTPPGSDFYGTPITLSATGGGSNNLVIFSIVSGPGMLNGNTLTLTGIGNVVVEADQAGDVNYLDATPVQQTIAATTTFQATATQYENGTPMAIKVSTLLGAHYSDPDGAANTRPGIAVFQTGGVGTWQYSTNGTTWTALSPVASTRAFLLPGADSIRFLPSANWSGPASLDFVAWDGSQGKAATTANTLPGGASTPFSADAGAFNVTVAPVPSWVGAGASLTPISPGVYSASNGMSPQGNTVAAIFGGYFQDANPMIPVAVAITGLSGAGTWQYSTGGPSWLDFSPAPSMSNAYLLPSSDLIRFVPKTAAATTGTLTAYAWDGSGMHGATVNLTKSGVGTATGFSATPMTAIAAANRAPVLNSPAVTGASAAAFAVTASTTVSSLLTQAGYSDPDGRSLPEGIAITGTSSLDGSYQYMLTGGIWLPLPSVSLGAALLLPSTASLRFAAGLQTGTASLTFAGWDQTQGAAGHIYNLATSGGATAFSMASSTLSNLVKPASPLWLAATGARLTPLSPGPYTTANTMSPAGDTVGDVFGSFFFDFNPTVLPGIAISAVAGNGTWQHSSTGGASWMNFPTISITSALPLTDTDLIRFVPKTTAAGAATLTAYAWDRNIVGMDGTPVNLKTLGTGGASGFSSTTLVAACAVNTAPTLSTQAVTLTAVNENVASPGMTAAKLLSSAGYHDADKAALSGIAITGDTGAGTGSWQWLSGTTWIALPVLPPNAAFLVPSAGQVRFKPADTLAANTTGSASLTYLAWDQTAGSADSVYAVSSQGGTSAFSTQSATAALSVNFVKQSPSWTAGVGAAFTPVLGFAANQTQLPGGDTVAAVFGAAYFDPTGASLGIAISALGGAADGAWQFSTDGGATWTNVPTVSTASAFLLSASAKLRFVASKNFSGTVTLTAYAWDGTGGFLTPTVNLTKTHTGGMTPFSATALAATCQVNTAPTLTP